MERSRLVVGAGALLAAASVALYWLAMREPSAPPPAPPLPPAAVSSTPTPRPKPPPRRTPRSTAGSGLKVESPEQDEPAPAFERARISGQVTNDAGEAAAGVRVVVMINGRRRVFSTGSDGRFDAEINPGQLVVFAERMDGALRTRSEELRVDASEGGEWQADLVISSEERAGLGVRIAGHEDGLRVRSVIRGGPGEEVGIEVGDIILAVDGESLSGRPSSECVNLVTGPVGTRAALLIRREDGTEETVVFERQPIDSSTRSSRR